MAPHDRPSLSARLALALTIFALPGASVAGGPLDPQDFASLGTLTLANDSFTIDTDALEIRDGSSTLLFTGVADDQDGTADYVNNVWIPSSSGIPEIAVFAFDGIDLQSSATITVLGSRALALVSHGSASIDTTIDLSPPDLVVPAAPFPPLNPPTVGFAGGFTGGTPTGDGDGPGGGLAGVSVRGGGPAGFGAPGFQTSTSLAGPSYGDIVFGPLQGGSGGGGMTGSVGQPLSGAAAGAGALEISAVTSLTLGSSGSLVANGGKVFPVFVGSVDFGGGPGAGGGIRLSGQAVHLLGTVDANSFQFETAESYPGGGRVAIFGYNQLPEFVVGQTTTGGIDTSMIGVEGGQFIPSPMLGFPPARGVITVAPQVTIVPLGQSLTLGEITDLSDANRNLFLVHHDLRVSDGGTVAVPTGGFTHTERIELFPPSGSISGSDPLANRGEISGTGVVGVDLSNEAGGTIDAINDALTFTNPVVNDAGAQINAIGSALDFQGGLINNAGSELNLINTTVSGSVASVAAAGVMIAGTVTFGGEVSGSADFGGTGTTVFQGDYRPGASPGQVAFGGDVVFDTSSTLFAEIGGLLPGSEHDRIDVSGDAIFDGVLDLSLVGGFTPIVGQALTLLTHASAAGEFASIAGVSAGAVDLAVVYGATALTVTAALRGDVNLDGAVDAADRVLVEQNLGLVTTAYSSGDVNGSGAVDVEDLDIVIAALATVVPALPASGLLVLIATLTLTGLRYAATPTACSHRAP